MTKPLPWFALKIFVEPLLMWKGDPANVPSSGPIPEGSDTSPGLGLTSVINGESQAIHESGLHLQRVPLSVNVYPKDVLWNNQCKLPAWSEAIDE